jgi:Chemotaxis phosphatase CheX
VTTVDELEEVRQDLETLLTDVLYSVVGEEAYPTEDPLPGGPVATSRLSAHDELSGTYLGMKIRVGAVLARLLASRMMAVGDPSPEDLLDAVGELGNIIGGNVKTLMFHTARLSLPVADLADQGAEPGSRLPAMTVRAQVFGQVAELAVIPDAPVDGLFWPPSVVDDVMESSS